MPAIPAATLRHLPALALLALLAVGGLGRSAAWAAEPTVSFNGWTNTPGVQEGTINVHPVNATTPRPTLGYVDYLPKGYNPADTATKWPVVFALLGVGEQGDGTDTDANAHQLRTKMTTHGPLYDVDKQHWDFPCIVISPQAAGAWSNPATIKSMVDYVKANYRVDTSRIYMTGLADGSAGTLRFAIANPGVLAGIIPIEPTYGPTTSAEATALAKQPLWIVQCFADQALNRRNAIAWMNQVTLADTGVASDLAALYPGYGATNNHYLCDTDPATGLPLTPAGLASTVTAAVLTNGSATVALPAGNLIANGGSFLVSLWGGSDAAPFTRVTFGADPTSYVVKSVSATSIVLTHPYTGSSQTADAHIATPVGTVVSAYYQPATGTWAWPRTSEQTPPPAGTPDNRVFTMHWQSDASVGWADTYLNGQVWDWLFRRPPVGSTVATVTLGGLATTYTGAAQAVTTSTSPSGLSVTTTYNGAATQPVNAGSYAVVATVSDPVYTGSTSGTLVVAPAAASITLSGLSATYDGAPKPISAITAPAGVPIAFIYSSGGAPVEPGSYAVSAAAASANYIGSAAGTLVIAKASATVTLSQLAATSDGSPKPVTATTSPANLAVTVTYSGSTTAPSAPGSYPVVATISDAHYQGAASATLVISAAAAAVTVAEHGDHQVIQRAIGTTSGAVQFSGTFSGARPDHLDARVVAITSGGVAVNWTTVASAPTGSTWSAGLTVPQGGWYRVEVRSVDVGGATLASAASTLPWGVGINILCIGQSNMVGFGDTTYTIADDRVGQVRTGISWQHLADPWIDNCKASCGPALGSALVAALDIPIGLVPAATLDTTMVGTRNSDLSFRNPANHADPATTYGRALRWVGTAGAVEFVCVSQGAAEAALNTVGTSDYLAAFAQMESNFREDLPHGAQVRFVLSQLGRRVTTPAADAGYNAIREAHRLLEDGATTLLAGSTVDFPLADGVTHYGQAGQDPHGRRFARAILFALGQRATYGGPRIAGATFSDSARNVVLVTIAHRGGNDFQPTSAIPGFAVRDASGPKAVTAARVSGSVIALTCSTPCSGATAITYLEGMNPAGPLGLFQDNQADPEPLLPVTAPLAVQDAAPAIVATVTLSGLTATYDGAPHAATVATAPNGLTLQVSYNGATAVPVNAGSYAVVATVTTAGYTGTATGTLTIAPRPATTVVAGLSPVYNGAPHTATVTTIPAGLGTTIRYDFNALAPAPTSAGPHEVDVTITDPNYVGSSQNVMTIAQAPVTVAIANLAATYDGAQHPVTITTSPAGVAYLVGYFQPNTGSTAPVAAGSYAVTANIIDPNYVQVIANATLVIAPAPATVTAGSLSLVYDGAAHQVPVTTSPAGLATSVSYDGGPAGGGGGVQSVGVHHVLATISDPNYSGSATATVTITQANATVTLTGLFATFDGFPHSATATTTPAGLATTITYNGALGNPTTAGQYAVVATISDASYIGSATGTLTILASPEPALGINGWTNTPGVVEGTIRSYPVDTTLPKPPLGFVAYLPKGYNQADTTTKWPVVMYLAGIGEAGDGTNTAGNGFQLYAHMTTHGPLYQVLTYGWDFPAIIIAPQAPANWNSTNSIKAEMDYAKANFRVDAKRVYLTGLCDGACGALRYSATYPTDPAAILPIEAGVMPGTGQAAALKSIPMWAAHCFADPESTARTVSIAWVDGATGADTGVASDCMATYPGYGTTPRNHFACDADPLTGFPLLMNGPTTVFGGAALTSANKYVNLNATVPTHIYNMWNGSTDAKPFARFFVNVATPNADYWAKAGVMVRDSTAAGAKFAAVLQMPNNEVSFQWRDTTDGPADWNEIRLGGTESVKNVKLDNLGSVFEASYTTDNVHWFAIANKVIVFDNATYLAGLAVTAHNNATTYTQTFSAVQLNGAAPHLTADADIGTSGNPGLGGSASLAGGVYTITGGGSDIWDSADHFHYDYQTASGNTTISAQVGSNPPSYPIATAYPTGFYATKPYVGATATTSISVSIPIGINVTGSFAPASGWTWARDQHLDTSKPGKHIFTMFWYQDHVQGWRDTWGNPEVWNWLFSQVHP